MQIGSLFSIAVEGLRRQIDKMNGAATQVLLDSTAVSTPERVSISDGARQAAESGSLSSGIEGALVDLRVSKYLAVANLRVMQTGEELASEIVNLKR
jgi:hypothetical protein